MEMPNVPLGQWPVKTIIKKRRYIEVTKKF